MKIGFFITARLKSTRLKYKILLPINGKSVLDRVIERCQQVKGIDGVVLCTSINPQDSILYDNAIKNNIQFYAGSEVDVLDRLLSAANYFGYDAFISITADNPLFSIYTSQLLIDYYKLDKFDFIFTKGLPIGCGTSLLDVKSLQIANYIKKDIDTEIWGPFVNRSDFFNVCELIVSNSTFKEEKRITCDYSEDYLLIRKIYSHFKSNYVPDIQEVLQILNENVEYWKINENKSQSNISNEKIEQINKHFEKKREELFNFANSIDKKLTPNKTTIYIEL